MTVEPQGRPRWILRTAAGAAAAWALLAVLFLLGIFPDAPRTARGWVALVVCGPPAYLALAWLGERVIAARLASLPEKRFSPGWFGMMASAVAVGSGLVAASVWISLRLGR